MRGMVMQAYHARYEHGRVVLLEDAEIPEGNELIVIVLEGLDETMDPDTEGAGWED